MSIIDHNKISILSDSDLTGVTVMVTGKIEKGENPIVFIAENSLRMLIGFKNFSVTYTQTGSTHLPGYMPSTQFVGYDRGERAPGVPFILGWQDFNAPYYAAENGWLTTNETFNNPVIFSKSEDFSIRTSYEPFKGLRIDLTGMRNYGEQHEQNYYYDSVRTIAPNRPDKYHNDYFFGDRYMGGSYSISVVTIATAFERFNSNNIESAAFNDLRDNRYIISARLHNQKANENEFYFSSVQHVSDSGYFDGYSATSPDVVIPAFYSAYTGIDALNVTLKPFHWLILPNWRISFDGLTRIEFFKRYFKSINLTHSYKSTYSIGSFASNLAYFESEPGFEGLVRNLQNDFISPTLATSASIVEQLSPLIGVDMTWVNSFTTKFEWRRSRNLSLSMNNNQLTETANEDYVIGAGYRFKDLPLTITTASGTQQFKSDLNIRLTLPYAITSLSFVPSQTIPKPTGTIWQQEPKKQLLVLLPTMLFPKG
jgi:cell surface protein SprA